MDKLSEIMAWKAREIAPRLRPVRESELARLGEIRRFGPSFRDALRKPGRLAVIAEIKRASPSAGMIKAAVDSVEQARLYTNAGADAMSVLTDAKFFCGEIKDLWEVVDFQTQHRRYLPCLCKDFILDSVQIVEAAEAGARCILLIVRALDDDQIRRLYSAATIAGLDTLFEVHDARELERALAFSPKILGVNNRNLNTFKTDLAFSEKYLPQIPANIVKVAESGIQSGTDAARMKFAGADALLVGEALMRTPDPGALLRELRVDTAAANSPEPEDEDA
ncbi:MAG: indole-3-glycerol phosphate synthase TrpC [Puniceicoccales bacterium]|jgi:indole-3-glycerol phosphate synthase|nr:indole-3-glycerol phosphate synthase TrpC [Puniceicoccales bacterium]